MSKNLDVLMFFFMERVEKAWNTRMNRAKFFRAYPKTAGLVKLILTKDELTLNSLLKNGNVTKETIRTIKGNLSRFDRYGLMANGCRWSK